MKMFQKAQRTQAKLKLGLSGPSGSGKSMSALRIAKGMLPEGGKIAVIDTENNSASLYADRFDFDTCSIKAPYHTDKYLAAMKEAEGYDIVIIDSVSHQWDGDGGILKRKEQVDNRGGNSFTNWSQFTPEHERFKAAILQYNTHLICTLRSKQDYIMSENSKGKTAPQKVGLAPIQRESFEYEFTTMLEIAMDHTAKSSKDRTSLFARDRIFTVTEEIGKELIVWLNSGKAAEPDFRLTLEDRNNILMLSRSAGYSIQDLNNYLGTKQFLDMNADEYKAFKEKFTTPKERGPWETEADAMGPVIQQQDRSNNGKQKDDQQST